MTQPIFEQDLDEFLNENEAGIRNFIESSTRIPFMGHVTARLVAISMMQNPLVAVLVKLGFNADAVTNVAMAAFLLGVYAERQGWTFDDRDLDLSVFEDK